MRDLGATPLEMFLALAPPETVPPAALLAHHERLAAQGAAEPSPRRLPVDDFALPPRGTRALSWAGNITNCAGDATAAEFFTAWVAARC